ncbi:hypothetical protein [Mesorhizobium sp.]|uniref:hypothetical protein n=1 Tax=Mesorhizobium sp. TaxID=1871066 RepID=UPI0025E493FA|nr:hypothetical protein [Mesorhizobium sp.]
MPASAQSSISPVLTAEQCIPLTEQNYAICCVALNRDELLTRAELDQCPPITTGQVGTDDAGTDDSGTDDGGTDDGGTDDGGTDDGGTDDGGTDDGGTDDGGTDDGGTDNGGTDDGGTDDGTDDGGTDDGGTDDGSSDDAAGNPGNEKSVGAAGEGPGPHSPSDFGPTGSFGKGDANGNAGGQGRRGDAPGHN